ncbi:lysozyme [Galbibacter pacificus]|uniref:Lysozyme n=1 Tax=Galbibacter pacificus TaxID=2996052 RepID=A0ABT6FQC4_9FLAO|nr:lysozyme [Galbibacter pacificus]MDG3582060.1 lysozyme [Galbibacter pacificus]MDG3585466.1 lysozyme [Galbibacter pacificus]
MKVSKKGIQAIKKHEALRLCPYLCPSEIPTIGYGNTFYEDGRKVALNDDCISEERANRLFLYVLYGFEQYVNQKVTKTLLQGQFDALVSFCYNVGKGAFASSTLLKKVNVNPFDENIKYQFSRWNKSNGKVLKGLVKRRKEEAEMYYI